MLSFWSLAMVRGSPGSSPGSHLTMRSWILHALFRPAPHVARRALKTLVRKDEDVAGVERHLHRLIEGGRRGVGVVEGIEAEDVVAEVDSQADDRAQKVDGLDLAFEDDVLAVRLAERYGLGAHGERQRAV